MVNLKEFERLLLTNWTSFINYNKLIALVLSKVRDSELNEIKKPVPNEKKSLQIKISKFTPNKNGTFDIWVDFIIPKSTGTALGTCELCFDSTTGSVEHTQTVGTLFTTEQQLA